MFKTIASFINPLEAHIARGRLEAEGIPGLLVHEYHVWANWAYAQALGGVKLQVHKNLEQAAMPVMRAHFSGQYETALAAQGIEYTDNICNKCRSSHYKSELSVTLLILSLISLSIQVVLPVRKNNHTCNECRHKWRY